MCVTLTKDTQLTLGSVFITVIGIASWSSPSVISKTLSASTLIASFPSTVDVAHVLLEEPTSPFSKSLLFYKTSTLITAVPSHDMNQGSTRTISISIKMITPSYRFTLLQCSKPQNLLVLKYASNCSSISHTLTCLLLNLKKHYFVQSSFQHLPIRGQWKPVNVSRSIYIILTFKNLLM